MEGCPMMEANWLSLSRLGDFLSTIGDFSFYFWDSFCSCLLGNNLTVCYSYFLTPPRGILSLDSD